MSDSIESSWDTRYKTYGERIEGVLQKSFPKPLNEYFHKWMFNQLKNRICKGRRAQVLDLGCGYGRLSKAILDEFPKAQTKGVDISHISVGLYNKNLSPRGRGYKSDIKKLPFRDKSFDFVFMVTTLMYVTDLKNRRKAMDEIFRVLKSGGKFVFIERNPVGQGIVTLGGLVEALHGKRNREILAVGFSPKQMTNLINNSGGNLLYKRGVPLVTLLVHFLILFGLLSPSILRIFLKYIESLDKKFSWLLTPSLYFSYSGAKK